VPFNMSSDGLYSDSFYNCSATDLQGALSSDFDKYKPLLLGDYYVEPDDVVRGVTLPLAAFPSGDAFFLGHMCDGGKTSTLAHLQASSDCGEVFDAEFEPPSLSEEIQTFLACTTLQLSNHSPVSAGNGLLSFLRSELDSKVGKVNKQKFTIRAEVFVGGLWCSVKVRIYLNDGGSTMELQRRSGDSISFFRLYHQVSELFLGTSPPQAVSMSPPQIPEGPSMPADQRIAPLLAMADSCKDVSLLAEVASALSAMVDDPAVVAELRMPCGVAVVKQLAQVDDFRVSFPMSRLLSCI